MPLRIYDNHSCLPSLYGIMTWCDNWEDTRIQLKNIFFFIKIWYAKYFWYHIFNMFLYYIIFYNIFWFCLSFFNFAWKRKIFTLLFKNYSFRDRCIRFLRSNDPTTIRHMARYWIRLDRIIAFIVRIRDVSFFSFLKNGKRRKWENWAWNRNFCRRVETNAEPVREPRVCILPRYFRYGCHIDFTVARKRASRYARNTQSLRNKNPKVRDKIHPYRCERIDKEEKQRIKASCCTYPAARSPRLVRRRHPYLEQT